MRMLSMLSLIVALGLAVGARDADAVSVDLNWLVTSNTTTVCPGGNYASGCTLTPSPNGTGTMDIFANPGDTLYLQINVTLTAGETVTAIGVSIEFDNDLKDELDLLLASEYSLSPISPLSVGVSDTQESSGGTGGFVLTCENASLSATFTTPGSSTLCLIGFVVTGNVQTDGKDILVAFFGPQDGALDGANVAFTPTFGLGASVNNGPPVMMPEPGIATLMGLGLAGLVLAGRRNRA
jgi:hypothetical protein